MDNMFENLLQIWYSSLWSCYSKHRPRSVIYSVQWMKILNKT